MAAVLELDESNGATETVTHGVTTFAMGTEDETGMVPGAPGAKQQPGVNSMQKAIRVHLTALGGATGIENVRVFCDPSVSGWALYCNLHETQATYDATKVTAYVEPTTSTTPVPNSLPVADPGAANLGVGGSLTLQLLGIGYTDYLYMQARASEVTVASFSAPIYFAYDEL